MTDVCESCGRDRGFSLIELLVAIVVIGLIAAMLLSAVALVRERAHITSARNEVNQIRTAWVNYMADRRVPPADAGSYQTVGDMVALLSGADPTNNPLRVVYMEFTQDDILSGMRDPWDQEYNVRMNATIKQTVVAGPHGAINAPFAIWSKGPNGSDATAGDRKDDITSWKR